MKWVLRTCRKSLVDREGSAAGLEETVVGGARAADSGVLAGVLDTDGDTSDTNGDLLAVKTDEALSEVVEGDTEAGKGVLGLVGLVLKSDEKRRELGARAKEEGKIARGILTTWEQH